MHWGVALRFVSPATAGVQGASARFVMGAGEVPLVAMSGSEAAGCWIPAVAGTTPGVGMGGGGVLPSVRPVRTGS